MAHAIKVDNSRPATVRDIARTLGVSKKRTDELVRQVRQMIYRDANTGKFVIRAKKSGTTTTSRNNSSRNASTKIRKTTARRAKA
jgi:tRNA(Ser,Leu) C12 N-acetylase TAN1